MFKRFALGLTFIGALALASFAINQSAEAGCRYGGGGYYGGYGGYGRSYGFSSHYYPQRSISYYGGHRGYGGYGGGYGCARRGFSFSYGY